MNTTHYKVVFDGKLLPGFDTDTVKSAVQSLFRLSDEETSQLFSGSPKVLKSGLAHDQALAYQERLQDLGADVRLTAAKAPQADTLAPGEPPASGVESAKAMSGDIRRADFQFTGSGIEYFGIWIVNIVLTIVTLGIYSAWATVRNNQYFYGNTQLDGASFQYMANPVTILKGRLIALAVFATYMTLSNLYVEAALVFAVALIPAVPWVMVKSLRFTAINSAYRNVRFDFQGRYGEAFMVSFVWPMLNLLALTLLTPVVMKKTHEFIANGSRYGTSKFSLEARTGDYYLFFVKALLIALLFGVPAFLALLGGAPVFAMILAFAGYMALFGYFLAGIANLFFSSAKLQGHGFDSDLEPERMVWIYLSNSFLVAITLGLYTPWAKCRLAKYRASRTSMMVDGDLNQFAAAQKNRTSALGQELGDAFDVDFAAI